jgi:hypothetical protein
MGRDLLRDLHLRKAVEQRILVETAAAVVVNDSEPRVGQCVAEKDNADDRFLRREKGIVTADKTAFD